MTHLETELKKLHEETASMWRLVLSQLEKSHQALIEFDKELCHEVVATEKRVNGMELALDRNCEHLFALHTPVATDLRFVLAVLKIVNNLERLGDIAEGICKYLISEDQPCDKQLMEQIELDVMFTKALSIVEDTLIAFQEEDSKLARSIFQRDKELDLINNLATGRLTQYIKDRPDNVAQALNALSIVRRLERVGDQSENMAEEVIFYLEAKVLRHKGKKKTKEN